MSDEKDNAMTTLRPVSEQYLRDNITLKPGDRLHRLVARLCDTHIDDLTEDRIEALERQADEWRWMKDYG